MKLLRKETKNFFADLGQITLINNDKKISDDENIAKTFNNFFLNVAKNLNLKVDENLLN